MRHESKHNTRVALFVALLSCCTASAAAQTTLQQATFRSASQPASAGEDAPAAPSTSVASALQQLASQAAIIFTGSVAAVAPDSSGGAQVKFVVEQGIRGVAPGAGYSMHVSPWAGGAERYHVGERALFLLTAPSVAGYSAPVMGERGVVPLSGDTLVGNLDLRWIATDVQRGMPAQTASAGMTPQIRSAAVPLAGVVPAGKDAQQDQSSTAAPNPVTSSAMPDVHAIDRDLVLDLLRIGNAAVEQAR